jgi:GNAT superfamily N-acetyltransferase
MALRALHIATWMATYRDRVPEAFYEQRVAAHRARDWDAVIRRQTALGGGVLVVRCDDGVVGLCQHGPTEDDDDDPRRVGHIHRLYVSPLRQRAGIGRSLLAASTRQLCEDGMSAVTLWALETDERARSFYERLGWQPDGARRFDGVADVRYRRLLA